MKKQYTVVYSKRINDGSTIKYINGYAKIEADDIKTYVLNMFQVGDVVYVFEGWIKEVTI